MKRLLMVAYHFPPLAGSSGIQRTLRFVQELPRFGWEALVLSVHPRAYERTSQDLNEAVPAGTVVRRAFALDTARHLSIRGRYPGAWARPDRWVSWKFDGVRQGLDLIRQSQPDAIWSTYPIATAHLIGAELQRRSGLPWVADFRDPMAQDGYPTDPVVWQHYKAIETQAAQAAALCTFTTPSATRTYQERYPHAANRMLLLENGYDEQSFAKSETETPVREPLNRDGITLLHSGIVYPAERDPTQLFDALAMLKRDGRLGHRQLRIRFRAAVHDDLLNKLAAERQVQELVEIMPPVPYAQALGEMLRADGLLVMQSESCNEQVPAKIYEYMRAGRPIVCLSSFEGDTCGVLRDAGVAESARLDSAPEIADLLARLVMKDTRQLMPSSEAVARASRHSRAQQLAIALSSL